MLLAVICILALLTIALAVAVPDITRSLQREQEIETMHRGKQYIRAIQLYYRKFGTYPPSIDALIKTDNIRFLRKRYLDPITRADDWKPIYFGQNKVPLAIGFFGQPLGGIGGATPIAGTGPSSGNTTLGAGPGGTGSNSSFGSSSSPTGSSLFGSSDNGTSANGAGTGTGTSNDGSAGSASAGTDSTTGSTTNSGTGFMSGQSGQNFGGTGIVGFEPGSPKQSILLYKKKDHYNQWEFTYSPLSDLQQQAGSGGLAGGSSTPGSGSTTSPSGSSFGGPSGSTFGGSSSSTFGGSPSSTTTQPQQ